MGNVTKKDIVEEISRRTGLTQVDTKLVMESLLGAIAKALKDGRNIEIRGFGRFKVKQKLARMARNPRTGEIVQVDGGWKPVFEASKELKALLNQHEAELELLRKQIASGADAALLPATRSGAGAVDVSGN